jgi:membrane-associated phospholipid phosphatase
MGETRWPGRAVLVLASLIAVSTVYGRYHYLVDALAGVAVAAGAWLATRAVYPED